MQLQAKDLHSKCNVINLRASHPRGSRFRQFSRRVRIHVPDMVGIHEAMVSAKGRISASALDLHVIYLVTDKNIGVCLPSLVLHATAGKTSWKSGHFQEISVLK
jgi:hypothetical protein